MNLQDLFWVLEGAAHGKMPGYQMFGILFLASMAFIGAFHGWAFIRMFASRLPKLLEVFIKRTASFLMWVWAAIARKKAVVEAPIEEVVEELEVEEEVEDHDEYHVPSCFRKRPDGRFMPSQEYLDLKVGESA